MSRVEIPAPADLVIDPFGNALLGYAVTLKLAGTGTNATHWSALTGGTSTTGGLFTSATGTIVNGSGNRRYVDSGVPLDITINGLARQVEPLSASVERNIGQVDVREYAAGIDLTGATDNSTEFQTAIDGAVADGRRLYLPGGDVKAGGVTLKAGLHLVGDPNRATRLILPALDFVGGVFGTGTAGVSCTDVVLEDLVLDGQQQSRSVSCGNALLKAYKARRWTLRRVTIKNGTSYGFGWQGYPGEANANKQDIALDLMMEECYLYDNGYIGGTLGTPRSGTNNSSDNIDIKSGERVVLNKVYSAYSSDPCLDLRARVADLTAVMVEGGAGAGIEIDSHRPSVDWPDNDSYVTVLGGFARGCLGSGIVVSSTTGESDTHADLIGFRSIGNQGSGFANNAPTAGGVIRLNVQGGKYNENAVSGLSANAIEQLTIDTQARGNGADGVLLTDQDAASVRGDIRSNGGWGVRSAGTSQRIKVDAVVEANTSGQISLAGTGNAKNGRPDLANGQVGVVAPTFRGWAVGDLTVTANRAYYVRFVPSRDMLIATIGFVVITVDGANPNVDVALYSSAGTRLVSAGATAGKVNALGRQTVAVSATLIRANTVYYAAFSTASAAVAHLTGISGGGTDSIVSMYGSTMPTAEVMIQATSHPLPSSATPVMGGSSVAGPVLSVNE